jgi:arylsulfatase
MLQDWRRKTRPPWNCGKAALEPEIYQRYIAYYYALTSEVDHCCGLVLKELENLGLAEDTLVIYASDHGDFVAHHGMVEKCALGHNVYEDTLRIPMIWSWPGRLAQGQVRDDLVELLDLFPTVLELTGVDRPLGANVPPLAGRSLVPTLTRGDAVGRRYAFSENWSQTSVIGERHKLGVWTDPSPTHTKFDVRGKFPDMLFDRETDPMEVRNLSGQKEAAAVERELREALQDWEERTPSVGKQAIVAAFNSKLVQP